MLLTTICGTALAGAAMVAAAPAQQARQAIPVDYIGMVNKYKTYVDSALVKKDSDKSSKVCKTSTVTVRKEWRKLSAADRTAYLSAVQCLIGKKAQANKRKVPGARNRLDDFVASHLVEGENMHFNGWLYPWHRHFVWLYEQALKTECGYNGAQPYWDWTLDAGDDLLKSPVFDGSATSMGSNGEAIAHGATTLTAFGLNLQLPAGTGGGCLKSGPFKDLVVNLGLNQTVAPADGTVTAPIPATIQDSARNAPAPLVDVSTIVKNITNIIGDALNIFEDLTNVGTIKYNEALNYNPRCLKRDLNTQVWSKHYDVQHAQYLLSCTSIDCLQRRADGMEDNTQQVHPAGHFGVGGLQNDPFASPGDPIFYLIHAQLDRMWSIWQAQAPDTRLKEVGGTRKPLDADHSGTPVTLNDKLSFGVVDGKRKINKLLSPLDNFYCYRYE